MNFQKKLFENFDFVLKKLKKEFLYYGVLKTMFLFFGLIQKQIFSDAVYLLFIYLKILQWILKAFELFCPRWNICK